MEGLFDHRRPVFIIISYFLDQVKILLSPMAFFELFAAAAVAKVVAA